MVRMLRAGRFETPPKPVENRRPSESGWTIPVTVTATKTTIRQVGIGRRWGQTIRFNRSNPQDKTSFPGQAVLIYGMRADEAVCVSKVPGPTEFIVTDSLRLFR